MFFYRLREERISGFHFLGKKVKMESFVTDSMKTKILCKA